MHLLPTNRGGRCARFEVLSMALSTHQDIRVDEAEGLVVFGEFAQVNLGSSSPICPNGILLAVAGRELRRKEDPSGINWFAGNQLV